MLKHRNLVLALVLGLENQVLGLAMDLDLELKCLLTTLSSSFFKFLHFFTKDSEFVARRARTLSTVHECHTEFNTALFDTLITTNQYDMVWYGKCRFI